MKTFPTGLIVLLLFSKTLYKELIYILLYWDSLGLLGTSVFPFEKRKLHVVILKVIMVEIVLNLDL